MTDSPDKLRTGDVVQILPPDDALVESYQPRLGIVEVPESKHGVRVYCTGPGNTADYPAYMPAERLKRVGHFIMRHTFVQHGHRFQRVVFHRGGAHPLDFNVRVRAGRYGRETTDRREVRRMALRGIEHGIRNHRLKGA